MEDNLEKCVNYDASRSQRKEERARGLGDEGTYGFEKMGCYDCPGLKKDCPSYFPRGELTK